MSQGANNGINRPAAGECKRECLHAVCKSGKIALNATGNLNAVPLPNGIGERSKRTDHGIERPSTSEGQCERLDSIGQRAQLRCDIGRERDRRPLGHRISEDIHRLGDVGNGVAAKSGHRELAYAIGDPSELIGQIVRNGHAFPLLDGISERSERSGHLLDGTGTESGEGVEQAAKRGLAHRGAHGRQTPTDLIPIEFGELTECGRQIDQALRSECNRTGTHQTGDSGQGTCRSGYSGNLAHGTTHGNKAASDLVPAILGERIERLGNLVKTLHGEVDRAGSDDS